MNYYWVLREKGYSNKQIRSMFSKNLRKLGEFGGFYTIKEFSEYTNLSQYESKKYFKSCYDESYIQKKLNVFFELEIVDNPTKAAVDYLNKNKIFTKSGIPWTKPNFYSSNLKIKSKGKKIHSRHLELWSIFDKHREKFESYNQAVKYLNQNKYYQKSGKPWSRQLLSLIIQKYPELDWSLTNKRQRKYDIYSEEYAFLNTDCFDKYESFEEMQESLDLPEDQDFQKLLHDKKISKSFWNQRKKEEIKQAIIDILKENSDISYAKLWVKLAELNYFPAEAKKKSQRMYNFMKRNNLLDIKRCI